MLCGSVTLRKVLSDTSNVRYTKGIIWAVVRAMIQGHGGT